MPAIATCIVAPATCRLSCGRLARAAADEAWAAQPRECQQDPRHLATAMPRFTTAAIVAALLTSYALAQTHTTVRHHRETVEQQPAEILQAEDAIQKNDLTAAEPLLKKALDRDPKNYQAWFDLGFVLNRLNRRDESIYAYRQSVAAKPDVFESNLNLGLMLARASHPDAEQFLRAATRLTPSDRADEGRARAWVSLGHLLENSKPDEAVEAFKNAAVLTPKDPEPRLSAGLVYERKQNFPAAEAEYKEVMVLDPHSTEAAIGLTNLYMKSGRLAEADPLLRRLSAERPEDAGLHLQLGRVLAAQGKIDDAVPEFQAALKLTPNDADAQRELADLLVKSAKFAEAEKLYRAQLALHPTDAALHQSLGEALLKQRKFPEAQEELTTAVRLKPDLGPAYGSLAFAASENQNYPLVIQALDTRAKLLPEVPVTYFLRATAFDHLRDYKQASEYYHHFLDVAQGKYPDQEWQARHRLVAIEPKKH